ncbi:MAG: hypothetical protein P4L84_10820 [Isosphaeraceae bacterium]|nr:hypothetical protein [Isosphaeraceae bacterium]
MQSMRPVLLLTQDERLVQVARLEIYTRSPLELVVARTVEEGLTFLSTARPCAVVVHLEAGLADEQVSELLWAAAVPAKPVPVVALSDQYDEARAKTMFDLGVADYLGRREHLARLAALLTSVVPCSTASDQTAVEFDSRGALLEQPRLPRSASIPAGPHLPGLQRFPILGEG